MISLLKAKRFRESDLVVPSPHVHCYNPEYDVKEDAVIAYLQWIESLLQEQHGHP